MLKLVISQNINTLSISDSADFNNNKISKNKRNAMLSDFQSTWQYKNGKAWRVGETALRKGSKTNDTSVFPTDTTLIA